MNVDTGQIKRLLELREDEKASEKWIEVSPAVARAMVEADIEAKVQQILEQEER